MNTNSTIIDQEVKPSKGMNAFALKWAAIMLMVTIITTMIQLIMNDWHYMPRQGGFPMMLFNIVVTLAIMFFASTDFRKNAMGDVMSFGKAFSFSYYTCFLHTLFVIVFMLIFYNLIIDYDQYIIEETGRSIEELKKKGLSDSDIKKNMDMVPKIFYTQWMNMVILGVIMSVIYLIYALIIAAITKRTPKLDHI
ncbi:MAG TPA: DUF4199 domain-containing protein [Bacteroidia bacterium]